MLRRAKTATVYKEVPTDDEDENPLGNDEFSSDDNADDSWNPEAKGSGRKSVARKPAKPREPKAKKERKPKEPRPKKEPKPKVPRPKKEPKPKAERKPRAPRVPKGKKVEPPEDSRTGTEPEQTPEMMEEGAGGVDEAEGVQEPVRVKDERLSFPMATGPNSSEASGSGLTSSTNQPSLLVKKEEPGEDFTFGEPVAKKQKTSATSQGRPVKQSKSLNVFGEGLHMNWDPIQVLAQKTGVEQWVCANIAQLIHEENTIPFLVRYRKEMINYMDADALREVQLALEELCALAKKCQSVIQTLKKDGVLTSELDVSLRNCRVFDELDHVYSPYKKGSKLSKARRAKQLGLEPAVLALLQTPQFLNLHAYIKPNTEGLSTYEEVATGVEQILADMIAKDPDTLTHVRSLCDSSAVMLQSCVSKTALKEKQEQHQQHQQQQRGDQKNKIKDIDKFQLYSDFSCHIHRVQPHQTLAINRGENLKILTVKVNVPDRVKNDFCRWCVNLRWRPKGFARPEQMKILNDAIEDSYKRLILPLLCRGYRTKLTVTAEKESVAMFVRNLRQRLLVCPVRGRAILGVDPGYRHGCKLAILSPVGQILQTDVVYLHSSGSKTNEAGKVRHLMLKHSCQTVVIGNGTACRETEAFFADLIKQRFFQPLDVSYCIADEAGASIYSVSAEAVKEMPDLDPNIRSAVSIGRRVQDPLAELVKIDPKHIGIGTYQHDVSQPLLRAALDGTVQECVSFVGVDINICSETLMRHVAGLNAGRARSIAEWREKSGPFQNREQLKQVKGLGPKSFQQCAGFIRINPETAASMHSDDGPSTDKPLAKKGKGKASAPISNQPNPLDQTCIHPESYNIAMKFLSVVGGSVSQLGQADLKQRVEECVRDRGLEDLGRSLDTSPDTLQLIVDGLTQPPGFDMRQEFDLPDFKRGIVSMSDLRPGAVLTGRVTNTALFGAFVDVGVGRNGLIPNRFITAAKLPEDLRRRSLALGPGQRVEVSVIDVDHQRKRITLDLLRVLR